MGNIKNILVKLSVNMPFPYPGTDNSPGELPDTVGKSRKLLPESTVVKGW